MRRWVALGGTFLILFALALPARAGLGDLLGGVLEDPISELTEPLAPLVTSVPLVEDLIETTEALTAPVVTAVESVASPVVTVVDEAVGPIVEPVEEVVDPEVVEPPLDPVTDVLEPVLDVDPLPPVEPTRPIVNPTVTAPRLVELTVDQARAPTPIEADSGRPDLSTETASIQRAFLTSISDFSLSVQDREGNGPVASNNAWLSALKAWLRSGVSALLDVVAIPARLLEILLRALLSAGSGLVAPAAILVSLAVGGRRRLLPAS